MGRDIFMLLITSGIGALLTFVVAIGERVNEIHRQVAVNQATIQLISKLEARVGAHEHMPSHSGAQTALSRLEVRVESRLSRIESQLEELVRRDRR